MRAGLEVYVDRFMLANTLLFSEVWDQRVSAAELDQRKIYSKYALEKTQLVVGEKDISDFFVRDLFLKRDTISEAIKAFKINALLKDAPVNVQEKVLKDRLVIEDHEGEQDIIISYQQSSSVTFVANVVVNFEVLGDNIELLSKFMLDKQPPFNVPRDLLFNEFIDEVSTRFSTLRNSLSGMLDYNNAAGLVRLLRSLFGVSSAAR